MPSMQVHLPEELYRQVLREGLEVSEILQKALREELAQREKIAAIDEYINELAAEVVEPVSESHARATGVHCATGVHRGNTLPETG